MSRLSLSLGLCAALLCGGASADELFATPTPSAYFGFSFGGAPSKKSDLHLGFALRQSGVNASLPALAQMDFDSSRGLLASLGGYQLNPHSLLLNQTEAAAEPAAEQGWFSQFGDFVAGLGYGTAAIVGVALVGTAVLVTSAGGSDDSSSGAPASGGSSPDPGCTGGGQVGDICAGDVIPCPLPLCGNQLTDDLSRWLATRYGTDAERDFEHQQWLDSGTGQMGDLLLH